jgi:hypothetical protein
VLEGNIPRFPWTNDRALHPKLTCGLTGNTERPGSTETPHQHRPADPPAQPRTRPAHARKFSSPHGGAQRPAKAHM